MSKLKGYIITACGIMLKGILSVVLTITGETETSGAVSYVINFIVIVCCISGIMNTIKAYKGEGLGKALIVQVLIITVGFILSKIIVWAIIIGVIVAVFLIFSGRWIPRGISFSESNSQEMSSVGQISQANEERRRKMKEEIHRTTGVHLADIHVNSDGTKYYIGDGGDWNNLSRDGKSYEDNDGNWHNFS